MNYKKMFRTSTRRSQLFCEESYMRTYVNVLICNTMLISKNGCSVDALG